MKHYRDTVWLLGIPIDRLTLKQAVRTIISFSATRQPDCGPRLVTTVNTDFLANVLPWFGGTPRHPELIEILRQADLCTADGMPLLWIARLLGGKLPERVTGADLVPELARAAVHANRSMYLLGGKPEVAQCAADTLRTQYPGLRIAGVHSPFVSTKGLDLADAVKNDKPLCAMINNTDPDILLVAFGNPKQELWFARNRTRLKAGVVIGVGGTFDFIAGHRARAPRWMQRGGLEWLFRLLQEPRRLLRRYAIDAGKLVGATVAAAFAFWPNRGLAALAPRRTLPSPRNPVSLFHSAGHTVRLLNLTKEGLENAAEPYLREIEKSQPGEAFVFDCGALRTLNVNQQGSLMHAWRTATNSRRPAFLINIGGALLRSLRGNRAWDVLALYACGTPAETVARLAGIWPDERGFTAIEHYPDHLELKLFGTLEAADVAHIETHVLAEQFARQPCFVSLDLCSTIDSSGAGFLLQLYKACEKNHVPCHISGTTPETAGMIRAAGLGHILTRTCPIKHGPIPQ